MHREVNTFMVEHEILNYASFEGKKFVMRHLLTKSEKKTNVFIE